MLVVEHRFSRRKQPRPRTMATAGGDARAAVCGSTRIMVLVARRVCDGVRIDAYYVLVGRRVCEWFDAYHGACASTRARACGSTHIMVLVA